MIASTIVEAIIYLLLYNLHNCAFNSVKQLAEIKSWLLLIPSIYLHKVLLPWFAQSIVAS